MKFFSTISLLSFFQKSVCMVGKNLDNVADFMPAVGQEDELTVFNTNAMQHTRHDEDLEEFLDEDCIDEERYDTLLVYLSLFMKNARYDRVSLSKAPEITRSVLYSEDTLLRVGGAGEYKGSEDIAEYVSLAYPELNGDTFGWNWSKVIGAECLTQDRVVLQVHYEVFFQSVTSEATQPYYFEFAQNKSTLTGINVTFPALLVEGLKSFHFSQTEMCELALLRCPGDLYPFENLQDCYKRTSYIPQRCEEDGNNDSSSGGIMQGDSMGCRYLHLLSSSLRPALHCAHMKESSIKCYQERCPSLKRLEEPVDLKLEVNADHALWLRIVELVILIIFFVFPILAKIFWHSKQRKFIDSQPPSSLLGRSLVVINTTDTTNALNAEETYQFPSLVFEDLNLAWTHESVTVIDVEQGYIGGCQMTGISGESGSGKTTFIKLLCGFNTSYMTLKVKKWLGKNRAVYCPQSTEMWLDEMPVKDILLFASAMAGTEPSEFNTCFEALGLHELYDQPFGTLSGGQKQRVNIAAAVIQPIPKVIFLDEPLAALDHVNALRCVQILKTLPVKHAFVMTVHQLSAEIECEFDRILHFDAQHCELVERKMNEQANPLHDLAMEGEEANYSTFLSSFKASLILWFGQFYGLPLIEVLIAFVSISGALVVGALARGSTADWVSTFLPTDESLRIPFYMADYLVGMGFITSFGASLLYANRERRLINHMLTLHNLDAPTYLLASMLLRGAFLGILQALLWVYITLPMMGLLVPKSDIILMNTAAFGFAWTSSTFGLAFMTSSDLYSSHVVMLMDVLMVFFSGVFFYWTRLYEVFKVLHYINPLFYILSATARLVVGKISTGCDEKDHPGTCANGARILEMTEIQEFSSIVAQAYNIFFASVIFVLVWYIIKPTPIHNGEDLSVLMKDRKRFAENQQNNQTQRMSAMKSFRNSMSTRFVNDHRRFANSKLSASWSNLPIPVSTGASNRKMMDMNIIEEDISLSSGGAEEAFSEDIYALSSGGAEKAFSEDFLS